MRLGFGLDLINSAVLGGAGKPVVKNLRFGVNMGGAEYSPLVGGPVWPSTADWAYLASKGVTFVRLPIAWEGIQPTLSSALNSTYLANLKAAISGAWAKGISTIVDLHNFGHYCAQAQWTTTVGYAGNVGNAATGVNVLGDTTLTSAAFVDVWTRLATALVGTPGLIGYELMNEPANITTSKNLIPFPNGMSTAGWFTINGGTVSQLAIGSNPLTGYSPATKLVNGSFGGVDIQLPSLSNIQYTISFWGKCTTGTVAVLPVINDQFLSATLTTSWQRFAVQGTPSAGSNVNAGIVINSGTAGVEIDIANFQLEVGASASTYAPSPWFLFVQPAITAIRAIDATTEIHIDGYLYGSAATWTNCNNDHGAFTGGNLIQHAHQYFDGAAGTGNGGNYLGTYSSYSLTSAAGVQDIQAWLNWLSANSLTGFLGECGVPNNTTDNNAAWLPLQANVFSALKAASISGTQWFYGNNGFQSGNQFNIMPVAGVDDPRLTQMLAIT